MISAAKHFMIRATRTAGRRSAAGVATALGVAMAVTGSANGQCTPAWLRMSNGTVNERTYAFATLPNGDLVAAGGFSIMDGISIPNRVARYALATGTWSPLSTTGTNASGVYALAVLASGDVVAGGNFTAIGGVATRQLARYDFAAQAWTGMGYGNNGGAVYAALTLPGNELIIGGSFARVAGIQVGEVARLNVTTGVWSSMNSDFNSSGDIVYALALAPDGTVIVAGSFLGGAVPGEARIARYHPTTNTWSSLGSGVNNVVKAVVVLPDGDVIAGGYFTTAGGVPASLVARYHPATNTWSPIGSGVSGSFNYINAITTLPGGDLVVGGSFTNAGGVSAARIARLNPATNAWSALGAGVNVDVSSLVPLGNDVVAGGLFNNAGGSGATYIARYTFGASAPVITTPPQPTAACAGSTATFTVVASGGGPFIYQWRKGVVAINTIANPSAATAVLALVNVQPTDAAAYSCTVTNACSSATSTAATLIINSADFNNDGDIGTDQDIEAFFRCLAGNCCAACGTADFNADGDIGTDQDIEAFFRVLAGGNC